VLLITYPIYNTYVRRMTREADGAALGATRDRAEAVRALVRYADDDLLPLCDRRSVRWYFDDRPPLGARIAEIAGTADPCPGGAGARSAVATP
jgi:Zn-dependent protease with chaperone function